jgi:hypothetical protein
MTLSIVGFDDLVTSFVATIATGWSDPCRVGLSPTGKPRLYTAHSGYSVTCVVLVKRLAGELLTQSTH